MEAVISTGFSIFGTMLSAIVLIIFIRFNHTPVVKASTREVCYIVLFGMILSHLSIFTILALPNAHMCALSRVLPGISFSMIYGSLFIKTNRIARLLAISKKRFPSKKLRFMSSISQVVLALILIFVESCIAIGMLLIEKPDVEFQYPTHKLTLLVCKESQLTILAPLAFIFILILLCVWYAFKTRNIAENFNETKYLGFAIYTTCIIWLAFFPIYFGSTMQILTKCICISLSSIMTLSFMFFPKIYIILLHPEKNVRALFTTSKSIRCHIGATRHSNISQKTSSSVSSVHGTITADFDSAIPPIQRSFKKSSSCQTSHELLSIEKVDTSSSPIREDMFEFFFPVDAAQTPKIKSLVIEEKKINYRKVPTSPSHQIKLKKNKIYMKDMNGSSNIKHNNNKKQKSKLKQKQIETPIYCAECMELEKQNQKLIESKPIKAQIFTVERIPLEKNLHEKQQKIAISEESLSECSISDSACKFKRITIQLK